jgi:hypothetical protein
MLAPLLSVMLTLPNYAYHDHRNVQDLGIVFTANVIIGCAVGGIGSSINGGKFAKGCLLGSIGGIAVFDGKLMVAGGANLHGLGAAGKLVVDAGSSIMANAASNLGMLDRLVFTLGPLEYEVVNKTYRVSLLSAGAMLYFSTQGKLDWRESLYNLTPVFGVFDSAPMPNHAPVEGSTVANVVAYNPRSYHTLSHELVHTSQWAEWKFANDVFSAYNTTAGQDLAFLVSSAYVLLRQRQAYYYSPQELESYYLQR